MTGDTILKLNHISKLYPGVVALDDMNMEFREGEVHAIVGENGAGKSTMIKTISGAIEPSAGTIELGGETFERLTPKLSREKGVAVIYQEFTLVPVLSVADNIFMGEYMLKGMVLDRKAMEDRTRDLFERLHVSIDPKAKVADLTTGFQQIVEIAKAISKDARVLIMDEPSAPLTMAEVESMYEIVDRLKEEGVTIIYISHRMEEIFRLSDRTTVIRDGKYIQTLNTADTNKQELIKLMVGRELNDTYPSREKEAKETVLKLEKVSGNGVKDISFEVKKGEILGLGGLVGAGRTELAQLIFGSEKLTSGRIIYQGQEMHMKNCKEAIDRGIAMIQEDRKRHGVVLNMSIRDNTTLPCLRRISRHGVISGQKEEDVTKRYQETLRIKTPSNQQLVKNLSGGNQQKVVLAKWLAMDPEVIIFDEPTRGIDVGAKQEIYDIMNDLANQGKCIIMISSDMEELIGMSDRVIVLCKGRMAGSLSKEEVSQESILTKAAGIE
ncbi:sugar ABC transporter ATP-binding protein [Luxibacter massiliensis]|uniref:sugar ABC transporter ATP-binding protein n=1 Tax=Luxibacter massiliensis TaxID=2219695 RepID=UPI000F070984|nr:sugar ABC transporter ATP-binding protein [Luxibacter massiliensis]